MFRVNVEGTRRVIEAARAEWVQKLVFTSSASVVFDGRDQAGVDESAPYPEVPFDDYNASKAEAEAKIERLKEEERLAIEQLKTAERERQQLEEELQSLERDEKALEEDEAEYVVWY